VNGKDTGMCVTLSRTLQVDTALMLPFLRSHGLRRGARRRQGCPEHQERKLCSLIRLFFRTDFVHVRAL
jgi:hypothetical protein